MDMFSALGNFVRVVDTGSFTRVARESGLSCSAVTRQISYLEEHFGVRLLHRTTRQLSLTGDGEILLGHARRLLEESSAMEQDLCSGHKAPEGLVRLGCVMGAGMSLAGRLPRLLRRHAGLAVELVVCDHINEMVEARLDIALCHGEISASAFIARQISTCRHFVVAAPSYLRDHRAPEVPMDLTGHVCIPHGGDDRSHEWEFDGPDGVVSVPICGQLTSSNERVALVMARGGHGVACLPYSQVIDDIQAGHLVPLLPRYEPKPSTLYAIYPSRRQLARRTRAVLDFLIQEGRAENEPAIRPPLSPVPRDDGTAMPSPIVAFTELRVAA